MKKQVIYEYFENKNGKEYNVVISAIKDWEGFEKLAEYIKRFHQAELIEACDGPDARRWFYRIDDIQIELIHDDLFGNYLCSPDLNGKEIIDNIGKALEEKLKNQEYIND